jgi:hypothetical protein
MQTLTFDQCRKVSGGECGATGNCGDGGGYGGSAANGFDGVDCANAMMAWGGLAGNLVGGLFAAIGGLYGGFAAGIAGMYGGALGSLGGAAMAAAFSNACAGDNSP